ncbi:TRP C-terminal domain-containing protein [Plasmodiophora brassicae]
MLDDDASGSWPQPLLGVGTESHGAHASRASGPKYRLSSSGRLFLAVVVAESVLVAAERLFTDVVWKLPTAASHGRLDSSGNWWFFLCFLISALYNVLFAFDAVLNESRHALFACLASSALLSARAVVEFAYKESACASADINWICIPGLIEIIAYQVFLISLGLGSVISQMGFRFYRIVGADLALREIYERYAQFVTLFRLNQQLTLLAFCTALFFATSAFQVVMAVLFLAVECAWEFTVVVAVHNEDAMLTRVSSFASLAVPVYLVSLLVVLSGEPFFYDGLMLFKIFAFVVLSICARAVVVYCANRLQSTYGQGFRSRILPKLNLLALALPIRTPSIGLNGFVALHNEDSQQEQHSQQPPPGDL